MLGLVKIDTLNIERQRADMSIKDDDLRNLEELLTKEEAKAVQDDVERKISLAINYSEKSSFPEVSEITDEVYG